MTDFRDTFSVENVRQRFVDAKSVPVRGTYRSGNHACLLGSFEHVVARMRGAEPAEKLRASTMLCESVGQDLASVAGVDHRTLRILEAGWEECTRLYGDVDGVALDREFAPRTQEEADAYEWGLALGNLFVDASQARQWGLSHASWLARLDARIAAAGLA